MSRKSESSTWPAAPSIDSFELHRPGGARNVRRPPRPGAPGRRQRPPRSRRQPPRTPRPRPCPKSYAGPCCRRPRPAVPRRATAARAALSPSVPAPPAPDASAPVEPRAPCRGSSRPRLAPSPRRASASRDRRDARGRLPHQRYRRLAVLRARGADPGADDARAVRRLDVRERLAIDRILPSAPRR